MLTGVGLLLALCDTTACGYDWDAYDPRLGGDAGTQASSSSSSSSSSGMGGAGGAGGMMTGSGGSGGVGGAGGMGGAGGAGGAGGSGGAGGGPLCMPGTGLVCYTGPNGTANVGACKTGFQQCADDGLSYGPCMAEVLPSAETCGGGADEDCDGQLDEHCAVFSKKYGASGEQRALGVATGPSGEVVIVGRMTGSVDFGGGTLTSAGGYDVFVAKFDAAGVYQWAKRFGSPTNDEALGVSIAADGRVLVSGYFTGTIDFGGAAPLVSADLEDAFVLALGPDGTHVFDRALGGMGNQRAHAVAAGQNGSAWVGGGFDTEIMLGASPDPSANARDAFVLEIDAAAATVSSRTFGGSGNDEVLALATNAAGEVAVTGYYDETVDFGAGPIVDAGSNEVFLAKLAPGGAVVFGRGYASPNEQMAKGVGFDSAGNILLAGLMYGPMTDFGDGPHMVAGMESDMFVMKVDPMGQILWSRGFGDDKEQECTGLGVDGTGAAICVGRGLGTIDFGDGLPVVVDDGGVFNDDILVVKVAADGTTVWGQRFGNSNDQDGRAIAALPDGSCWITGEFGGMVDFGNGTLTASSDDIFLAKLAP